MEEMEGKSGPVGLMDLDGPVRLIDLKPREAMEWLSSLSFNTQTAEYMQDNTKLASEDFIVEEIPDIFEALVAYAEHLETEIANAEEKQGFVQVAQRQMLAAVNKLILAPYEYSVEQVLVVAKEYEAIFPDDRDMHQNVQKLKAIQDEILYGKTQSAYESQPATLQTEADNAAIEQRATQMSQRLRITEQREQALLHGQRRDPSALDFLLWISAPEDRFSVMSSLRDGGKSQIRELDNIIHEMNRKIIDLTNKVEHSKGDYAKAKKTFLKELKAKREEKYHKQNTEKGRATPWDNGGLFPEDNRHALRQRIEAIDNGSPDHDTALTAYAAVKKEYWTMSSIVSQGKDYIGYKTLEDIDKSIIERIEEMRRESWSLYGTGLEKECDDHALEVIQSMLQAREDLLRTHGFNPKNRIGFALTIPKGMFVTVDLSNLPLCAVQNSANPVAYLRAFTPVDRHSMSYCLKKAFAMLRNWMRLKLTLGAQSTLDEQSGKMTKPSISTQKDSLEESILDMDTRPLLQMSQQQRALRRKEPAVHGGNADKSNKFDDVQTLLETTAHRRKGL